MKYHSTTIKLAIVACSPLIRLGISQFTHDLQLGFRYVLNSGSLSGLRQKLMEASATVLIVELGGTHEQLVSTSQQLLALAEQCPRLNIVVYTACRNAVILSALNCYKQFSLIGQQETASQLRNDMMRALINGNICSPGIKACLAHARMPALAALSSTERKVLTHLFSGLSLTDIALLSHRSIKTISAHKCNSMRKLGVRTDAELFQMSQAEVALMGYEDGFFSGE